MVQENNARLRSTTHQQYSKKLTDAVMRARKILKLLDARGRISMNNSGEFMDWRVPYREAPLEPFEDLEAATISRQDRYKKAELPWRALRNTDALGYLEKIKNKGESAIINYYEKMTPELMKDAQQQFQDQFWASGSGQTWHGIESMMTNSGAATAYVATNSGTYAGLSTVLGTYGGSWDGGSANWPQGKGDVAYDFWTPMIVDYTDTSWNATTKTWPNTCQEAISFAITNQGRNRDSEMDMVLLERRMYADLKDNLRTKEQLQIMKDSGPSGAWAVGFQEVINLDGIDVTPEYGIAASTGYGVSIDQIELKSLQEELFKVDGPTYHQQTMAYLLMIIMAGNFKFTSPRYFTKFLNVT